MSNGPLNASHLEMINRGLAAASSAMAEIHKAEACGYDCQQYRQLLAQYEPQLRRLRDTYFGQQKMGE